MHLLEWLAEQRLEQAAREGAFDDLPGAGKPLALDDDRLVPEDVRMAYRILRNSGFVPSEIETRKEAASLRSLLATSADREECGRAATRLAVLEAWLEQRGGPGLRDARYFDKVVSRFAKGATRDRS